MVWQVVLFNQTQKRRRKLWLHVGFDFIGTADGTDVLLLPAPPPWINELFPEDLVLGNKFSFVVFIF